MIRVALRPRLLGLLGLVLVAAFLCTLLSQWQWSRAQPQNLNPFADAQPVDITTVLEPGAPFTNTVQGRPVTATGTFDAGKQLLVTGRHFNGADGFIVLTPLKVSPHGAYLAVARGWIPATANPTTAPPPPTGLVTVKGTLVVSEGGSNDVLPPGQIGSIATSQLLNQWGTEIYTGYLVADSTGTAPKSLNAMPRPNLEVDSGLHFENISYAIQWIVFGVFGFFIYWRQVRDVYQTEQEAAEAAAEAELNAARAAQDPTHVDEPSKQPNRERE